MLFSVCQLSQTLRKSLMSFDSHWVFDKISTPKHTASSFTSFSAQWGCKWLIEISFRNRRWFTVIMLNDGVIALAEYVFCLHINIWSKLRQDPSFHVSSKQEAVPSSYLQPGPQTRSLLWGQHSEQNRWRSCGFNLNSLCLFVLCYPCCI